MGYYTTSSIISITNHDLWMEKVGTGTGSINSFLNPLPLVVQYTDLDAC